MGRIMGLSGKEIENGLLAFFILLLGFSAFDSVGFGCASFGYGGSSICKPVACGNCMTLLFWFPISMPRNSSFR